MSVEKLYVVLGSLLAFVVFGAYFRRRGEQGGGGISWSQVVGWLSCRVTWRGLAWSLLIPVAWVLLFYALVVHVRWGLGRWPNFGESLPTWALRSHFEGVWLLAGTLVGSLFAAGAVLLVCLFLPKWRHVSVYALAYGVGVALALASTYLAPAQFLNWFFD